MGGVRPLQPSASGRHLAHAPTVADRPLRPQPLIENILCARLWAHFLPSRNALSDERHPQGTGQYLCLSVEVCRSIRGGQVGASNPERLLEGK